MITLPRVWMRTPSSATGAAEPLVAGAAVDALPLAVALAGAVAIGVGAGAEADDAGVPDAEPADEGVSGCASLLPHASSTAPNITHVIVFVMARIQA
jgi:hypothetical protein